MGGTFNASREEIFVVKGPKEVQYLMAVSILSFGMMGVFVFLFIGQIQIGSVLLWGLGILFAFILYYSHIIRRPKKIVIISNGFILVFRWTERAIAWNNLGEIFLGKRSGALRLNKELRYYPVSLEAAQALGHAYHKQVGKEAPVSMERQVLIDNDV